MPGSDWKKIVELLYENDGYYSQSADDLEFETDDYGDSPDMKDANEGALIKGLVRDCELDGTEEEVRETLENLVNVNLIQQNKGKRQAEIVFKPDGFEVAHERELTRAQDETNRYLVPLTFVLVIVQIISIIPSPLSKGIASLIVLGGLLVLIYRLGIFEPAI